MRKSLGLFLLPLFPLFASGPIRFTEVSQPEGISFVLRNAAAGDYRLVELMPGGVGVLDYNHDGCMDIFFANGAALPSLRKESPEFYNRLFRNNCDWTFTDVTLEAGVAGEGYSMGVAAADFDNDGDPDLFVSGVNRDLLYRNQGDGTFVDISEPAGMNRSDRAHDKSWSVSAGWFDYDNDGWLDLFVCNYVAWNPGMKERCGPSNHPMYCHPDNYAGLPNQLYRNNRDGTFTDVSGHSGIGKSIGKAMGVAFADYDQDGFTDVFVANDSVPNFLFRNQGDGTFQEVGLLSGVALSDSGRPIAGMGADFRDLDNDGWPDLVMTGMIDDTYLFFRKLAGLHFFQDVTVASQLAVSTRQLTGWGMGIYDFDNDGLKDLFFANSHFPQLNRYLGFDSELPNRVFRNLGEGRFEDASPEAGADFQKAALYRGAAFADFDRDGKVDVVVSALNSPARLWRNTSDSNHHWIAFKLSGSASNRDGLGARLTVVLPSGRKLYNHATTAVGYASSSEPFVYFGLGPHEKVELVEIRWPGGRIQTLSNLKADQLIEVPEEGDRKTRAR